MAPPSAPVLVPLSVRLDGIAEAPPQHYPRPFARRHAVSVNPLDMGCAAGETGPGGRLQ